MTDQDQIELYLTEKVDEIIKWGCETFDIPIFIMRVNWTFSLKNSTSKVKGNFLKFEAFFALHDMLEHWTTGGIFNESLKSIKNDPDIGSFSGTGKEMISALVCHEMAHIFQIVAEQEHIFPSNVLNYFNMTLPKSKHHHNVLWKVIYKELKSRFMPNGFEKRKSYIESIQVRDSFGIDFYVKHPYLEAK